MNIETKQINIATVHSENILSMAQAKTNDIRLKIIELWNKQPIISQFPELVTIIEPTQQIAIIMQGKMVTVSNQEVKEFGARDLEGFLRLVLKTNELLEKPISAFGYNYTFLVPSNASDVASAIKTKMKANMSLPSMKISEDDFIAGGVNLSYMKSVERVQISITPQFTDDLKTPALFVGQCNLHFFKNTFPDLANLLKSYKESHDYLKGEVNKILG